MADLNPFLDPSGQPITTSSLGAASSRPQGQDSGPNPFLDAKSGKPITNFANDDTSSSQAQGGSESPATLGSVGKQAGYGLLTGLPKMPGGIIDTVNALNPLSPSGLPARAGEYLKKKAEDWTGLKGPDVSIPDIATPSEMAGKAFDTAAGKIDSLTPQPKNAAERVGRAAGEGAITLAVPALGEEGLAAKTAGALRGAFTGTTSGVGSQVAAEAVPEPYKPAASLIGGLVTGGLTEGGLTGAAKAYQGVTKAGSDLVGPLYKGGQERAAGTILRENTTNPEAALAAVDDQTQRNLVPGFNPTTFQLTGDQGVGQLERSVASQNQGDFQTLRGEQATAQRAALSDIQSDGHPEAVSGFLSDQLDDLDRRQSALHDQFQTDAQTAASGLGGGDAATLGEQARGAIQNRLDDVRTQERGLWNAVDPEGNLQTVSSPIKQAVSGIYGNLSPEARIGMAPVEGQIAGIVSGYGKTLPLQRLIDLRSAISQAMRDVRSPLQPNQPAYSRLTQLRGAIENAISDSVAQKAAQEQQAVATGAMNPLDTMAARLQDQVDAWRSQRALEGSRASASGQSNAGRGTGSVSGASGAKNATGAGSGTGPSGEDLSGQPFVDQEAANRLNAATDATAQRKQTYGAKPVSQILQRPGNSQPYTMPSGGVTSSIWKAGNAGADTIRAAMRAAGNSADAVEAVKNMAAQSLRDKAQNGVITQKILDAWRQRHASALSALEEVAPGTTRNFENAARAGEHLENVAANNKAARDSYQQGAVGKLLKVEHRQDVVNTVGEIFGSKDSVKQMTALVREASKDPEALQGLRKAVIDHINSKFVGNTEAGTSGVDLIKSDAFQTFMRKNKDVLTAGGLFSSEDLGRMQNIATTLKQANRSITGSKMPGTPGTAQDLAGQAKHTMKESILGKLASSPAMAVGAHLTGVGWMHSIAVGLGSKLLGSMRENGINNINDLVKQAMLDPDIYKALMAKAPKKPDTGSALTLASRLRNVSALAAVNSQKQH